MGLGEGKTLLFIILVKDTARWVIRFFSDLYESSAHYVILHQGARHTSAFERLAVLIRTLVPKFFLTAWPASEARA
jgi:hypothetical protein